MLEAVPEVMDHPAYLSLHAVYHQGIIFQQQEVLAQLTRPGDGVLEDRYFNLTQQPRYNQQGQIDGVFMFFNEVTEQVQTRQRVLTLNQQLATANDEQATALEGQWSANMALRQTQQQLHYLNQELEQRVQERTEQLAAANAQLHLANEELHSSNTQLRRTNADLDNFIYTASHDLKAPISNIEGLLTLLPGLLPAAAHAGEVADLLTLMQGSIKRFQRTINHLTDVGRLQAEFAQPAQALDLAAAVEDVRLDLLPQLTQAQGQLEVAVEGIQVRVFSAKNLRSLLYNLLSNAVKYGAPNRPPRVRLSCAAEGSQLVLRVQDNGLGLNERQQAKLFQLFQRLHDHVDGTGVGLYAVKKIVKNAGGTIAVESQPGVGTTFILVFPA